ncbi:MULTISPECIES: hypothetical protein [Methylosinus]|uniref:Uncharacterized protein n=1 Tax=Methylosinus trichosporium (strain ATCC 35070 / NCIMB 11131 / UNIQEM 75 / OB3b) TaxID=595536 RepID=A0A2D2CVK9_METT3|nr:MULTISPECIES: hypothetical protein [Methylosinus]ATQ66724.1 hypothetical protein CQW49_01545 [Methylosinus trichosporium OB3b]OBS53391.1 hypothetical protein A8B73_06355 [Methylosinus sp. 3S-1]
MLYVSIAKSAAIRRLVASGRPSEAPPADRLALAIMIWLAGALAYVILVQASARFGAPAQLFLLMLFAAASVDRDMKFGRICAFVGVGLVFVVYSAQAAWRLPTSAVRIEQMTGQYESLYAALRSIPRDGRRVALVNAPFHLYSSPELMVHLLDLEMSLTFVGNYAGCDFGALAPGHEYVRRAGRSIEVELPKCARALVSGRHAVDAALDNSVLERKGVGVYRFADDALRVYSFTPLQDFRTYVYYDWSEKTYKLFDDAP